MGTDIQSRDLLLVRMVVQSIDALVGALPFGSRPSIPASNGRDNQLDAKGDVLRQDVRAIVQSSGFALFAWWKASNGSNPLDLAQTECVEANSEHPSLGSGVVCRGSGVDGHHIAFMCRQFNGFQLLPEAMPSKRDGRGRGAICTAR